MAKRPSSQAAAVLDIFADESLARAQDALQAATAPVRKIPLPQAPKAPRTEAPRATATQKPEKAPEKLTAASKPSGGGEESPPEEPRSPSAPEPLARKVERNVGMKLRLPQSMKADFQTFKAELSTALGGTYIEDSNIGRPLIELLLADDRERILEVAREHRDTLRRPINRDALAMAEFDSALSSIFTEALRRRRKAPRAHD